MLLEKRNHWVRHRSPVAFILQTMDEQLFPEQQNQRPTSPGLATGTSGSGASGNLTSEVTALATRLKLAEERYQNLSKRNQITEESLLAFEKDIKAELRAITKQAVELRKHIADMNMKIDTIMGELGNMVHKPEFSVAERYLDLWQPVEFVTRQEAKRLIADAMPRKVPLEENHA
jgi:hypothetical protein